ncbi:hypothetical protein WA158_002205 [Blastocystis sp. Blastoise]
MSSQPTKRSSLSVPLSSFDDTSFPFPLSCQESLKTIHSLDSDMEHEYQQISKRKRQDSISSLLSSLSSSSSLSDIEIITPKRTISSSLPNPVHSSFVSKPYIDVDDLSLPSSPEDFGVSSSKLFSNMNNTADSFYDSKFNDDPLSYCPISSDMKEKSPQSRSNSVYSISSTSYTPSPCSDLSPIKNKSLINESPISKSIKNSISIPKNTSNNSYLHNSILNASLDPINSNFIPSLSSSLSQDPVLSQTHSQYQTLSSESESDDDILAHLFQNKTVHSTSSQNSMSQQSLYNSTLSNHSITNSSPPSQHLSNSIVINEPSCERTKIKEKKISKTKKILNQSVRCSQKTAVNYLLTYVEADWGTKEGAPILEEYKRDEEYINNTRRLFLAPCPVRGTIWWKRENINIDNKSNIYRDKLVTPNTKQKVVFIITDITDTLFQQQKNRRQSSLFISPDMLTTLYIRIHLDLHSYCIVTSTASLYQYISNISLYVAQVPYKLPQEYITYAHPTIKGRQIEWDIYTKTWYTILQSINGIYPTVRSLLSNYIPGLSNQELSEEEKENLLANCFSNKCEKALSKKIYHFFSSSDGNEIV